MKGQIDGNIKLKSEWNMTQLDFQRIDIIFQNIDVLYFKCSKGKYGSLKDYLNALKAFYRYLRPLLNKKDKTHFDGNFKMLREAPIRNETFYEIEKLHDELMIKRQLSGMGVFATRDIPIAETDLKEEFKR